MTKPQQNKQEAINSINAVVKEFTALDSLTKKDCHIHELLTDIDIEIEVLGYTIAKLREKFGRSTNEKDMRAALDLMQATYANRAGTANIVKALEAL